MVPMRRHLVALCAVLCTALLLIFAAWAPAAGDTRTTGPSREHIAYTADGIPVVSGGPECKAGQAHKGAARARDY